jgi:hypothetical protein
MSTNEEKIAAAKKKLKKFKKEKQQNQEILNDGSLGNTIRKPASDWYAFKFDFHIDDSIWDCIGSFLSIK